MVKVPRSMRWVKSAFQLRGQDEGLGAYPSYNSCNVKQIKNKTTSIMYNSIL